MWLYKLILYLVLIIFKNKKMFQEDSNDSYTLVIDEDIPSAQSVYITNFNLDDDDTQEIITNEQNDSINTTDSIDDRINSKKDEIYALIDVNLEFRGSENTKFEVKRFRKAFKTFKQLELPAEDAFYVFQNMLSFNNINSFMSYFHYENDLSKIITS